MSKLGRTDSSRLVLIEILKDIIPAARGFIFDINGVRTRFLTRDTGLDLTCKVDELLHVVPATLPVLLRLLKVTLILDKIKQTTYKV